jgi:hypothetical protein
MDRDFSPLAALCRPFDAEVAIRCLGRVHGSVLVGSLHGNSSLLSRLFEWFENRRQQVLADDTIKSGLATLALFPSAGRLLPLDKLALPGNFDDPLGLAELVDLNAFGGRREFRHALGMPTLDFRTYAVMRLPSALRDAGVPAEKRRAAVALLANRAGEIRDDVDAVLALGTVPLVECIDGEFRQANECYFDTVPVRECLADSAHFARLSKSRSKKLLSRKNQM